MEITTGSPSNYNCINIAEIVINAVAYFALDFVGEILGGFGISPVSLTTSFEPK